MKSGFLQTLGRYAAPEQTPSTVDEVIAALEPFDDDIVSGLTEALQTDDIPLQLLVLQVIQQIGPKAADAVPVIVAKLQNDDRCVQLAAASALGAIGLPG